MAALSKLFPLKQDGTVHPLIARLFPDMAPSKDAGTKRVKQSRAEQRQQATQGAQMRKRRATVMNASGGASNLG